jgi:hypothetical protein
MFKKMKFIAYFELNPEFDPSELAEIGIDLMKRKLYPAEGYNSIAWYMAAGLWGISIAEADSVEAIMNNVNAWRIAKPGIFKTYKIEPAMDTKELIPIGVQLAKKVKG